MIVPVSIYQKKKKSTQPQPYQTIHKHGKRMLETVSPSVMSRGTSSRAGTPKAHSPKHKPAHAIASAGRHCIGGARVWDLVFLKLLFSMMTYVDDWFFFLWEQPTMGRLNPEGFLPNAQCSGLLERVAGSSPSLPSAQLHLSQMCTWPEREEHGLLQQFHQSLFINNFQRSQQIIGSSWFKKLQHSSGVCDFGIIRLKECIIS